MLLTANLGRISFALVLAISLFLLVSPNEILAQSTGNIAGTVTYFDGTAISGATVTATNTDDGTTGTATTDASGAFSVTGLGAGTYSVSVTYSTRTSALDLTSVSGVTVTSGSTTTISSAILIGVMGWVACDSVITTNCVQSMTVNGASTSSARAEPFFPDTDVLFSPVYGIHPGTGLTYTAAGNPYRTLSNFSISTSDTFIIEILLDSFVPLATLATGGDIQSWSYDSGTKVATYTIKPVVMSRGTTCDASSCQNQADVTMDAYLAFGSSDMSESTAPAAWVTALNGGYISTNGQFVTYPMPGNNRFGFSAGAPHLKADGTLNTGFFKVYLPDAMLSYMWSKDSSANISFDSRVNGDLSRITATVQSGGLLMEQTGISYSVNELSLEPSAENMPSLSGIGLAILSGLFAILLLVGLVRRMQNSKSLA